MEENRIFKAYLRMLHRDLEAIKGAVTAQDTTQAEKLLEDLITDTQKGIED